MSRPSPLRDAVLKLLAASPRTALELANGSGTTVNCMQVSLARWTEEQLVQAHGDPTVRPRKYELGPKAAEKMPAAAAVQARAAQVSIAEKAPRPDPGSVNRVAADREWARSQDRQATPNTGEPETVEQFVARGGKIEKLRGVEPVEQIVRPCRWLS